VQMLGVCAGRSGATSEENGQDGLLNIDFTRPFRFKSGFRHHEQ